jgi:uncharacterized cupredoxin-like copper-binding protein
MKTYQSKYQLVTVILSIVLLFPVLLFPWTVKASGDLTKQAPVILRINLGTTQNDMRFSPNTIQLETSQLYRLILYNPSHMKHYFSSEKMARAVYTRKVQVNGPDGKPIAEIKGVVREIEVLPGGTAEWWFVPVKAGTFDDLKCTVAGHAQAGMTGQVVIR